MRVIVSSSASARLNAAQEFLSAFPAGSEVVIVGASRGASDDLARTVARHKGATFGLARFSLTELAARTAAARLTKARRAPGTDAGTEAVAARAVFDLIASHDLSYFEPVAALPGFPKALARTLHELRLAGVTSDELCSVGPAAADVSRLLVRVEDELERAEVDDRAALFRLATEACRLGPARWADLPLVLLDVPLDSQAERDFVASLVRRSPQVLGTVPDGDVFAREALAAMGGAVEVRDDVAPLDTDLGRLRRYLFTINRPDPCERVGDVRLFSAPGEGREAVEIVRRVLDEASGGVAFDEMAVLLRTPAHYVGLLEHACARGGVPAYFEKGTRRPDPAGRAFVALLSCAAEGLSAKRFDEYLSLGQVPPIGRVLDEAEALSMFLTRREEPERDVAENANPTHIDSDDEAVVAGTLRSPWRWEELIVESAVVGGRSRQDGRARWRRRLDGLAADYRYRIAELERDEPESPRIPRCRRDLLNLGHLRDFALPIIDELAAWPNETTWNEWLDRFSVLATRAIGRPTRVLQTLAALRPMGAVGPVTIEQARDVLHDRLVTLDWEPPIHRYGRLFVGSPHQARGRSFRVVFVPGLAERLVPQPPREDPLLLDEVRNLLLGRREANHGLLLVRQEERRSAERLLLKIAIGAARERLYLSYPRLDMVESRARVPSFYALDVMRAITGKVPDHRTLGAEAAEDAGARLAWPAPADPDRAIDDLEHDLAVLKPLLDTRDRPSVKGQAHYLLDLNGALKRSVISRWARGRPAWSTSDGIIRAALGVRATLDANRLGRRPYSLSALQRFASCPYQFLLATIYRLEPRDEPEPLLRMDPLTRGSLFHKVQAELYRALQADGELPVTIERLSHAMKSLEVVVDRVAADYAEQLVPAIDRAWRDEIDELRRDLAIWVRRLAESGAWRPEFFEFSFGLNDEGRDPRSLPDPVVVDGRFMLRGSVDLIERHVQLNVLRVTDHKTGRNRSNPDLIIGGGAVLQPVLYSAAIEQGLQQKVASGRLFYCTTVGGFAEHDIPIDDYARGQGLQALTIVDRAIELGFLAAAPAKDACRWCDFRPVCGPREEERVARKNLDRLADLEALRSMR